MVATIQKMEEKNQILHNTRAKTLHDTPLTTT